MTREQIIDKWETLDPRARDAWVALAVFKWRIMGDQIFPPEGEQFSSSKVQYEDGRFSIVLPNYTTDIAAAWTVLSQSDDQSQIIRRHNDAWYAEIGGIPVWDDTAEEAICLAAIISVLSTE